MQNQILFFFLLLLSFSACKNEKTHNITPVFVPFLDTFFEEANKRNLDISLDDYDLTVIFTDDEDHAGVCNFTSDEIRIDRTAWETSDYQTKEWIIFHELGHCILNRREHNNNKTVADECLSIMNESLSGSRCAINYHSTLWREYYLDELFSEGEELPDWYSVNQSYHDNFNRIYQIDTTVIASEFNGTIEFDFDNNFVIEMEFFDYTDRTNSINLRWDDNNFSFCKTCVSELEFQINGTVVFQNSFQKAFQPDSKLTIKKIDNQYRFFINEWFVHTFEFTEWRNDSFGTTIDWIDFTNGFTIGVKAYILEE